MTRRGHDGFTVIEMAVTLLLTSIVMAGMLSFLQAGTRTEKRAQAIANSQEDVRLALVRLARDVRSADPMLALTDINDYANKIELQLNKPSLSYVRWVLDPATGTLSRQVISGPNGSVVATTFRLTRVHNGDAPARPVFRYFGYSDTEFTPQGSTSADFANCTIRVNASVTSDTDPGPQPFTSEIDAQLRNRLPGGTGCSS
jgi:type II secretory pathway pseudopilin PulG